MGAHRFSQGVISGGEASTRAWLIQLGLFGFMSDDSL